MKATAIAPANIAFIKYWGRKNETLRLPGNGSISMNLSALLTTTSVEFDEKHKRDIILINGLEDTQHTDRVIKHLDLIRNLAHSSLRAKVVSKNNFPESTGLSSSASGFAALTVAAVSGLGLKLSEKELSMLARIGSGSACRSIPDGFVEWLDGDTSETSYATSLYTPEYWDIVDVVAIVSQDTKHVSSSEGQTYAQTSPFFASRQKNIKQKIIDCKKYLAEKNFTAFGELLEAEALELHAMYLTSQPSLIYLLPETLTVMCAVKKWRNDGLAVYFTLNTGQNIHLICEQKNAEKVAQLAQHLHVIKKTIINTPAQGARLSQAHLF